MPDAPAPTALSLRRGLGVVPWGDTRHLNSANDSGGLYRHPAESPGKGSVAAMSVLYRAMWNDDRDDLVAAALACFQDWVNHKSDGALEMPHTGRVEGTTLVRSRAAGGAWRTVANPAEVTVYRADQPGSDRVRETARASLVETRDDGSRWSTTLRVWSCAHPEDPDLGEGAGWLWVDVEAVSSESLTGTVIAAPALVRTLVDSGRDPRRRCVPVRGTVTRYEGRPGAEALA